MPNLSHTLLMWLDRYTLPWSNTMVSAATPGSSGRPRASASLPGSTTTADGTPQYGNAAPP